MDEITHRFTIPMPGRTSRYAFEEARRFLCFDDRVHYATTHDENGTLILIVIGYEDTLATYIKLKYQNVNHQIQDANGRFILYKERK